MKLPLNWEYVADEVMGGVSSGRMSVEVYRTRPATVLRGAVSLENNGGFIQIAADLEPDGSAFDASGYDGLALDLCGNGEVYDLRLRTSDLTRPWQSFRTEITAPTTWQRCTVPFSDFTAHKTDARFDAAKLRRIGLLAIGRVFTAELAVGAVHLTRTGAT